MWISIQKFKYKMSNVTFIKLHYIYQIYMYYTVFIYKIVLSFNMLHV